MWEPGIENGNYYANLEEHKMPGLNIKWEIPFEKLIEVNGMETCLKLVPGTREYLTHTKTYGNEVRKWENYLRK